MSSETGAQPTKHVIPHPRVMAAAGFLLLGYGVYSAFTCVGSLHREGIATTHMSWIRVAVDRYIADVGVPPTAARGLSALETHPGVAGWRGPYHYPSPDPWGHSYLYRTTGATYTIVCAGSDGIFGTSDDVK